MRPTRQETNPTAHGFLRFSALRTVILLAAAFLFLQTALRADSIVNSKHNLSVTGPGSIRAVSEEEICIFCHTPHRGRTDAALWNRLDSTASYIPYNSPTLKAQPGQPTGASKLCLSCHDGTIALGNVVSRQSPIVVAGGVTPPGQTRIGTDLRGDHPISFSYMSALGQSGGKLTAPATWDPRVKLDANSELQCTSCHNPHDNQWGNFLVMANSNASLCRQCHSYAEFATTSHATSTKSWNGAGPNPLPNTPYATVAENACLNCHESHHAGGGWELLPYAAEEQTCFVCHNGSVASFNLQSVFQKTANHPVTRTQGVHRPGESPLEAHGHVECVDCHNPHRAQPGTGTPPAVQPSLLGVTGIDAAGGPLPEARYEYEVCFKCHGDHNEEPLNAITRLIPSLNTLREFSPSSASFHPVEIRGVSSDVPSLIAPLTVFTIIYCSSCHNNDGAQANVVGSSGPHGSNFQFLLARQYQTADNTTESPQAYALCYGCHDRDNLMADNSFTQHKEHVQGQRVPCSICHDPHGIDSAQGNPTNNAHMINFDPSAVSPDPVTGRLEYRSGGTRTGDCFLRCHSINHSPKHYP